MHTNKWLLYDLQGKHLHLYNVGKIDFAVINMVTELL